MAHLAKWLAMCMGSQPKDCKVNRSKWTLHADRGGNFNETTLLITGPSSLGAVQFLATEFNLEAYKMDIKAVYFGALQHIKRSTNHHYHISLTWDSPQRLLHRHCLWQPHHQC